MDVWALEGPAAALEVWRDGIRFATARGLAEVADFTGASMLYALVDTGESMKRSRSRARSRSASRQTTLRWTW